MYYKCDIINAERSFVMNRVEIKKKAKESLKGKYRDAILLTIISFAIGFGVSIIIGFIGLNEKTTELISNLAQSLYLAY